MMTTDRPWPCDLEAERALLGSVMLDPWRFGDLCETISAASFHAPAHATVWDAIGTIAGRTPVDLISLTDCLGRAGQLEGIGGQAYLLTLLNSVPTSANAGRYARIVDQHHSARTAIKIASELENACFSGDETAGVIDAAMEQLNALQHTRNAASGTFETYRDLMPGVIDHIQALQDDDTSVLGITTGFACMDHFFRLRKGEMIVLAARPSIGKSALMANMARAQSKAGIPVGIFSYEMSSQSLALRAVFSESGVNPKDCERGLLSPGAWDELKNACVDLANAKIYIDSRKGDIMQLRARARRMVAKHDVQCIYVDYLQLIPELKAGRGRTRENAVADLSRRIKELASEIQVPIVVLSQLNREAEGDGKKSETVENSRPRLKHLRESGAIEQDADIVALLHRLRNGTVSELLVEKHRNGPTGIVPLLWEAAYTRFVPRSRMADSDVPVFGSARHMQAVASGDDF